MQLNQLHNLWPGWCFFHDNDAVKSVFNQLHFSEDIVSATQSVHCQPTLLLHTVSYTPSSPARCYKLSRSCPNADKCCRAIGESRGKYVRLPTQTGLRSRNGWKIQAHKPPNKHKTVPTCKGHNLASSLFSTKCLPCLLWQPTQLLCAQPTAFCTQLISHMRHELAAVYLVFGVFENIFTNKIWFDNRNRQSGRFVTDITLACKQMHVNTALDDGFNWDFCPCNTVNNTHRHAHAHLIIKMSRFV